ncbi:MAG: FAD-dependent oxidoreductase [Verrucomicrobiota bacterium]
MIHHSSRRQFIGRAGSTALALLAGSRSGLFAAEKSSGEFLFLEAEGFDNHGGWELDQQSMDQMGSPYLLAHGLGIPVKDATTSATFPTAGKYRVWVRTRDWVAPWKAPGAPGKFQILINGKAVPETFGTKNAKWHWHDGGVVSILKRTTISIHDLTGFEGRCEAILFCKDTNFTPVDDVKALEKFRRKLLNLPDAPAAGGAYDLVVVGAGLAGICTAISAARNGIKVALVQDRPVLGGNASSEVRVYPEGHTRKPPFPHIGDIVEEILPPRPQQKGSLNATAAVNFDDARKMAAVKAEKNITLLAPYRAIATEKSGAAITAIVIQSLRNAKRFRLKGKLFADCTGDAVIGHQAGADHEFSIGNNMGASNLWKPLDAADEQAVLKCDCKDKDALSSLFQVGKTEQPFPRCPWAIDLTNKAFPGRKNFRGQWGSGNPLENLGDWFWESGFDKNLIEDIEIVRDLNLRAMYGAWDALKNVDKLYPNHRLGWAAFIAGKRESRRLMGDVVLSADDFRAGKTYEDPAFPCSWHIDLHTPDDQFGKDHKGNEFISRATEKPGHTYKGPYWAPYRTLYSRNISNLFMAGRDISVTKDGLGPVRVMRTTGMMGEVVGKAAAICIREKTTPRGVYQKHLGALKELMKKPGAAAGA